METNNYSKSRVLVSAIVAFIGAVGLAFRIGLPLEISAESTEQLNNIDQFLTNVSDSLDVGRIHGVVVFFALLLMLNKSLNYVKSRRIIVFSLAFALVFGLIQVVCLSLSICEDLFLLIGNSLTRVRAMFVTIGYAVPVFCMSCYIMQACREISFDEKCLASKRIIDWHEIRKWMCVFILCWCPYFIVFYPGVSNWDVGCEISQFFHYKQSGILALSAVRADDIFITNMHPFFDTIIFGGVVKAGLLIFHSAQAGMAMYSVLQMLVMAFMYSLAFAYLEKVFNKKCNFIKLFVALCPIFPMFSISMLKDSLFSIACFAVFMLLLHFCLSQSNGVIVPNWLYVLFSLSLLFVCLTKNQGIYLVVLSSFVFLVVFKSSWKKILVSCLLPVLFYCIVWSGLILPICKVAPGGKQEALGFMFQQTALYVKSFPDEVTEEEKSAIEGVLPYDSISELYECGLQDPVKYTYNQDASREQLAAYYKAWFQMLKKHPGIYFNATANCFYGYFWIDQDNKFFYTKVTNAVGEAKDIYVKNAFVNKSDEETIKLLVNAIQGIPLVNIVFSIGMYNWIMLYAAMFFAERKEYKMLAPLSISILSIFVYVLCPDNANIRYVMPIIVIIPVIILIIFVLQENRHSGI